MYLEKKKKGKPINQRKNPQKSPFMPPQKNDTTNLQPKKPPQIPKEKKKGEGKN